MCWDILCLSVPFILYMYRVHGLLYYIVFYCIRVDYFVVYGTKYTAAFCTRSVHSHTSKIAKVAAMGLKKRGDLHITQEGKVKSTGHFYLVITNIVGGLYFCKFCRTLYSQLGRGMLK